MGYSEAQFAAWLARLPLEQVDSLLAQRPPEVISAFLSKFFSAYVLVLVNGQPAFKDRGNVTLEQYIQNYGSSSGWPLGYCEPLPPPVPRQLACDSSVEDILMEPWCPPSPATSSATEVSHVVEGSEDLSQPPSKRRRLPDTDENLRKRELNRLHKQASRSKKAAKQIDSVKSDFTQKIQKLEEDHAAELEKVYTAHALEIEKLREGHASELYSAQQAREAEIRTLREKRDSVYIDTLEKITKYHEEIRKLEAELREKANEILSLSRRNVELEAQLWRKKDVHGRC